MQSGQRGAQTRAEFSHAADARVLALAQMLVVAERRPGDRAQLDALCRTAGALAADARTIRAGHIVALAEAIEVALVGVRDRGVSLAAQMDALFVALDGLETALGVFREGSADNTPLTAEMTAAIASLSATAPAVGITEATATVLGLGLRERAPAGVEAPTIIYVLVGNAIFGVPMAQVHNILRPRATGVSFQVVTPPDGTSPLSGGVISYLTRHIPVIELAQRLGLPPVTPLARSRILVAGTVQQPFGVAVDTIANTQSVPLGAIRSVPLWLTQTRLGGLIWGAALVDLATLFAPSDDSVLSHESRWDARMRDVGIAPPARPTAQKTGLTVQTESGPYHLTGGPLAEGTVTDDSDYARVLASLPPPRSPRRPAPPPRDSTAARLVLLLDFDALGLQFLG